jgi:hypothetical protein
MRHPIKYNQSIYGNEPSNGEYPASIFASTNRKLRSTFLIHPHWV